MLRVVRRAALVVALATGTAIAAFGFPPAPPSLSPARPYALVTLVFNCASVGPVTTTIEGPGIASDVRDDSGSITGESARRKGLRATETGRKSISGSKSLIPIT
jgi:hypothetical protein